MSLSQTCPCGARFEVDETSAGQTVSCPECQGPVRIPGISGLGRRPLRTSGFALASVLIGVMLTFTVVGTVLAVVLGFVALVHIARHRDRVTGAGYAVFGIIWGLIGTGITVLALSRGEVFGTNWLRQQMMAGDVDRFGPLEFVSKEGGFAISRPSAHWGVAKETLLRKLAPGDTVLFVNVLKDSYLSVSVEFKGPTDMAKLRENLIKNLNETPPAARSQGGAWGRASRRHFKVREVQQLPSINGAAVEEIILDGREMGQAITFVVRIIKDDRNRRVFHISGWVQSRRFSDVQLEFRKAMDSFRILSKE